MARFDEGIAEDLVGVGATEARRVRLWVRSRYPGKHELRLWPEGAARSQAVALPFDVGGDDLHADHTTSRAYPDDFMGARPLEPSAAYCFEIIRPADHAVVGSGRFETSPADAASAPDEFSIGVMSCHQPFADGGDYEPSSLRMLEVTERAFEEHAVKRVLMLGDQMYADLPKERALFDRSYFKQIAPEGRGSILECSREEVRKIYQRRYRNFWQIEQWRRLLSRWSCGLIPDDHEIIDNFGSAPEHASESWSNLREGALDASFDYEGSFFHARGAGRPHSMHFSFEYGPVACFVMDLRSEKRATNETIHLYGEQQFEDLRQFLGKHRERPVLMIGLSVPLVHLPSWLAAIGGKLMGENSDAADRWSYPKAREDRDRFIRLLMKHRDDNPQQRLVLLGGDVHTGVASEIVSSDGKHLAYQLVSSAVSNKESGLYRKVSELLPKMAVNSTVGTGDLACSIRLLDHDGVHEKNAVGELNVGLVTLRREGPEWAMRLCLLSHDSAGKARMVYRSPIL